MSFAILCRQTATKPAKWKAVCMFVSVRLGRISTEGTLSGCKNWKREASGSTDWYGFIPKNDYGTQSLEIICWSLPVLVVWKMLGL